MTSVNNEYVYHECMTHPGRARASIAEKKALVLGGNGGATRQLLKHVCMERIVVAELDDEVVGMARRYLDDVHQGALDDPRIELVIGDAAHFVESTVEHFDLVVFDLTPPNSPVAGASTRARFCKCILAPCGAISMHLGAPVFHAERIAALLDDLRASFARSSTRLSEHVPLYGSKWLMAIGTTRSMRPRCSRTISTNVSPYTVFRVCATTTARGCTRPSLALPCALRDTLCVRR